MIGSLVQSIFRSAGAVKRRNGFDFAASPASFRGAHLLRFVRAGPAGLTSRIRSRTAPLSSLLYQYENELYWYHIRHCPLLSAPVSEYLTLPGACEGAQNTFEHLA
jgi:hypothetical protein